MTAFSNVTANGYAGDDFLKTYDLLEKIKTIKKGDWRVTPEMVEKDVGRMDSLEQQIRSLEGKMLPTLAEKEKRGPEGGPLFSVQHTPKDAGT